MSGRTRAQLPVLPIGNQTATYLYDESTPRVLATPGYTAFIKIAEGCDRPCAFCFIPQMRGHFRSRRFGSIMNEAQQLAKQGVKEIVLVAQDSSRYGEDLGQVDALAQLLRELCASGRHRVGARDVHLPDAHLAMPFSTCWPKSRRPSNIWTCLCSTLRERPEADEARRQRARASND